jgi:hypothetical protein
MEVNEEYLINEVGIESAIKLRFIEVSSVEVTIEGMNTCISVVVEGESSNVADISLDIAKFAFLHRDVRIRSHHPSQPEVFVEILRSVANKGYRFVT